MTKKLFIITGELSGDKHASLVVKNLLENRNDIEIEAIGGENLKKLGVKLFVDHSKAHMSAMGLTPKILFDHITLGKRVVDYLKNEYKPDLVLLIDYGGFNLNISNFLKKAGIKVFYYIPPQIWASRKWRIKTVKKNISKVMTIFPFEKEMYEKEGIDAQFVGHPLITQMPPCANRDEVFEKYGLDKNKKLISIFPGSRTFELHNLMKTFLKSAALIAQKRDDVQFVIAQADSLKDDVFKKYLGKTNIKVIKNDNYSLLSVSDALMLASGTVALEAALYTTPMIISYKGPWIAYFVYRLVRCINRVCLPNIIMDKDIVPELLQKDSNPQVISKALLKILEDDEYRQLMKDDLSKVKAILSRHESAKEVAQVISSAL
ncbi:MAG TPA: lipid-A-disaccharide synthase [Candidatus Limenecus avicola]|uniref:Lipid-A-disaccharide synthase n=1 Tax=Candidatus Limenecus avicola TaxID=2840847 RepID=A0A9D1N0M4_9CLOT|nr:lipid-A-disaccharide synthase [Candidatus Limenecus avicola]